MWVCGRADRANRSGFALGGGKPTGAEPRQTPGLVGSVTPREILHDRVVRHLDTLSTAAACSWLLGHGLLGFCSNPAIRPELRACLRPHRRSVLARNLLNIRLFQDCALALGDIPVAPLKGIALLDTIYREDPGIRPMGDIDVLVPRARLAEAVARLAPLRLHEDYVSHHLRSVMHHRHLQGPRGAVEVHSHLGLVYGRSSTWDDLPLHPGTAHERPVWLLAEEALLVHLLTHALKHRLFERLVWIDEILVLAELLSDRAWAAIPELARRLGARNAVAAAVSLLRGALGESTLSAVPALDASHTRLALYRALFAGRVIDPIHPLPSGNRWLSEIRPWLLADSAIDMGLDMARMTVLHLLTRYPRRVGSGAHI